MPALAANEVHAWIVSLNHDAAAVRDVKALLAPDEVVRAGRFHFARDHDRYVIARANLRLLLAEYLQTSAAGLCFAYTQRGKPFLSEALPPQGVRFNLSHSGELALIGLTLGGEIGVDVEQHRPDLEVGLITRHFFSARETTSLEALPHDQQRAAFYRCWTRKEAYLKARGDGLAVGLDRFDVSLLPADPPALLRNLDDANEIARWSLYDVNVDGGYSAAVAVEGGGYHVRQFRR